MLRRALIVVALATSAVARADEIVDLPPSPAGASSGAWREARAVDDRVRIAALELRGEATVNDATVSLKQICRWSEADAQAFASYAELIVARLPTKQSYATLTLESIRGTLRDAGLNPARVNFFGAATCTVNRSDVTADEGAALRSWAGDAPTRETVIPTTTADAPAALADVADLRSKLIADVAERLHLPVDSLQVDFRPEDRQVLSLAPPVEFKIDAQRYGDLGDVSWLVTIGGTADKSGRRVRIAATARAWMEQVVATRAIDGRQPIAADDVETHRVLADRLPSDPWLASRQIVGQQAARDVRPGVPISARMVQPVELVRPGQLVTVYSRRGAVEVKSVARASQFGTLGQTIKVKNETTGEVFTVTMTGRQTAQLGDAAPSVADAR